MGMYDDHKYVAMMQNEFNKPEPSADDLSWVKAVCDGHAKLEDITDKSYREYIKGLIQ